MAMAAQKTITAKTKHLKLKYQINFARALSKMKHRIVRLVLHAHDDIQLLIERTIHYVIKTIEAVREGRSTPRRLKHTKNGIHFSVYKSSL